MSLAVQKAPAFVVDFEGQYAWYARVAGWDVADRYLAAVDNTLRLLATYPAIGRVRHFKLVRLKGIRAFPVASPFDRHLIFYRFDADVLYAERVIHGARDLPRRLAERP